FIDDFSSTYPGYTFVGHLDNRIENGEVIFKYLFTEGHQDSNAIEVARTLGFEEEILRLAERIKRESEQQKQEEGN
ncbi:MAG: hypothetical protein NTZ48_05715, partial [Candidatus Omnitrophica bacterium]|nr:hypothetical protein [Candidatus Omnitrophota bacterium]